DDGAVGFAIEHHRHHRASRQARRGTADRQLLGFFGVVDDVVTGDRINGQDRRSEVDRHVMGGGVAVTRFVRQRCREGMIARDQ
ncbi:hypothetical protein COI42_19540, partial [Priestia aryabhattai]